MSITKAVLIFFLVVVSSNIIARNDNLPVGARSAGIGNSSVALGDVWSLQHNQAGLANLKYLEVGIYANRNNLLSEASQISFAGAMPTKYGVFGLTFQQYGFKLYNESKVGFAYSKAFGPNFRAGLMANYLQTSIGENYGKSGTFCVEGGVQGQLIKNLWIGAHIYNINRAKASNFFGEKIPTITRIGLLYQVSEKVFATAEVEKDLVNSAMFKGGAEYRANEKFYLRGGFYFVQNPVYTFGVGFYTKNIRIDFAGSFHQRLGFTPHLGLGYVNYRPPVTKENQ
jgi:hypothetical protein